jgi:hypothetical protein
MKRTLTVVSIAAIAATSLLIGGLHVAQGQPDRKAAKEKFPGIHRAMAALEEAKAELENPTNNFGKERQTAIESCNRTVGQFKIALRYEANQP